MKWSILVLSVICFSLGCKKSSSSTSTSSSAYSGSWKGAYTGTDDHGSFVISISTTGSVTGTATSDVFMSETFQLNGTVTNTGQLTATAGTSTSGAVFKGTLTGNNGTGTWSNNMVTPAYTGNWTGNKQ
jgi:hypothetical protein